MGARVGLRALARLRTRARQRAGEEAVASDGRRGGGEEISFLRSENLDCPYDQMVQIRGDYTRVSLYIYVKFILCFICWQCLFICFCSLNILLGTNYSGQFTTLA